MLLEPCKDNYCFGCGGANPQGLQLSFEQDDAARRIRAVFRLGAEYQGARGFLHGGIIATLLDEIMAKLSRLDGNGLAVTAELKVEYLKPVPVDSDLHAEAYEASRAGRNLHRVGEIRIRRESCSRAAPHASWKLTGIGPAKSPKRPGLPLQTKF